jgi:hypothetical protein
MNVQNEISDIRTEKDFRGISFSGYKLTEVKANLVKCLKESKIEEACYWSAEMVCSAHYLELWDSIICYYAKHIHIANPKMANYLEQRIRLFVDIIKQYGELELTARNNIKIRHLVCEVICMVCSAKKSNACTDVKILESNRDISAIRDLYNAPNVDYLKSVFTEEDPRELYIPVNELCYQVSKDGGSSYSACFWIEWINDHVKMASRKGARVLCKRRVFPDVYVSEPLQMDSVWLVWDALIKEAATGRKPLLRRVMDSLLYLFSLKYTSGTYVKRKHLLFFAVSLLTLPMNIEKEPLLTPQTKELIDVVKSKVNKIYRQIKTNEHSAGTDYLFNGLDKRSNLEKSLKKMEILNGAGFGIGVGSGGGGDIDDEDTDEVESRVAEPIELLP